MSTTPTTTRNNFAFFKVALPTQGAAHDVFSASCAEILKRAVKAEKHIKSDPRIAGFYAQNALELMVETVFDVDN